MSSIPHEQLSIVGIGCSAGGIKALQTLFDGLPTDLGVAYAVIAHLSPTYKSELSDILGRHTMMPVTEVRDSDTLKLEPNHVYVISPDRKLEITDTAISAAPFEQARGQRTAIDLFFRSLARSHGDGFAVILSGGGSDGCLGAKAVKEAGGLILVQDPQDAEHGSMPEAVIAAGIADVVAPVHELPVKLAELTRNRHRILHLVRPAERKPLSEGDENALAKILELLRARTGHDFSRYKQSTVLRRLARRMQLHQATSFADYLVFLKKDAAETGALLNDLLITVTSFFRDDAAWDALRDQVIGPLVDAAEVGETLRVWVPGCATGEEAYSLAILFYEEMERLDRRRELIIFASDVDAKALAAARGGRYPAAISTDVSDSRLERFFRKRGAHYQVTNELRDKIVFAQHSLLRDPPFSGLHLISCRNLLIYLDKELQEELQTVFRYACRNDGYLFLGISETAPGALFSVLDKRNRIFRARPAAPGIRPPLPSFVTSRPARPVELARLERPISSQAAEMHLAMLEKSAPPSVLLDVNLNVLHMSASVGRYLRPRGGELKTSIVDLLRAELREAARAVLDHACADNEPRLSPFVNLSVDGEFRRTALLASPRLPENDTGPLALLVFLEAGAVPPETDVCAEDPTNETVLLLREKLRRAEQQIDSINADQDFTHQELRAANEELQSLNEEYRSTAEELETSKEELQSINEELQTVNNELKAKLEETARAHNDLENLMVATDIPTLFLDRELTIKRFTPRLAEIFNVRPNDEGRPIGDVTHRLEYDEMLADVRRVLRDLAPKERSIKVSNDGNLIVRLRPYRTGDDRIDGVVLTFVDITEIKRVEAALRQSEARLAAELDVTRRLHRMSMVVATSKSQEDALEEILSAAMELHEAEFGTIQLLDEGDERLKIVAARGFEVRSLEELGEVVLAGGSASQRALRSRQPVRIPDVAVDDAYVPYREFAARLGYRAVQATPLHADEGSVIGVLSTHFELPHEFTARDGQVAELLARQAAALIQSRRQQVDLQASEKKLKETARQLLRQDRAKEEFLSLLGHELRNPLAAIRNSLDLLELLHREDAPLQEEDDPAKRAMTVLGRQSRHMIRLVNDLLDITRINQGKIRLETEVLDVRACVQDVIDAHVPECEARGLRLERRLPDDPACIEADPERIVQILDNLLRNAINFTDEGGHVLITVSVGAERVVIRVRDTGIGMDPGHIDQLFEAYRQARNGQRGGGLGLGLTLARRLAEMQGGTISASSEGEGRGSEFTLQMPRTRQTATARKSREQKDVRRRILVVDDNRDNADTLAGLLQSLGNDVKVVYDGASAVAAGKSYRPEVVFSDLTMPGMSGIDVARRLRQDFPADEMLLVAVSGRPVKEAEPVFDKCLLKPLSVSAIREILKATVAESTRARTT